MDIITVAGMCHITDDSGESVWAADCMYDCLTE